jgi:hypothetical protein
MQAPLQARNDSDAAQTDTAKTVVQRRVLADNRPEAVVQRKLAETMNNSPRVSQQRALSDAIHDSPRMVAQRHQINALLGREVKPPGDDAMPSEAWPAQREEKINKTGLQNQLKSGIESLSGMSMDHVKVHYNSDKPAQLQAHAYAQSSEIHVGPGQERHLPHEAWHIVQQAQGRVRVRPTLQMRAGAVNDDPSLEKEEDMMGKKAAQFEGSLPRLHPHQLKSSVWGGDVGPSDQSVFQYKRTFTSDVTDNDKRLIQRVLAADQILNAAWHWIKAHPSIDFTIQHTPGNSSINAPTGSPVAILSLHPEADEERYIGTILHELNLHLIPWLRPIMVSELENNSEKYDDSQKSRMALVLQRVGTTTERLHSHISADIANKQTKNGGNHSDMDLWAAHLEGVKAVVDIEADAGKKVGIILKSLEGMLMPLKLTGHVEDTIDRGPEAYQRVMGSIDALEAYREQMNAEQEHRLNTLSTAVRNRMTEYENYLAKARQVAPSTASSSALASAASSAIPAEEKKATSSPKK